MINGNYDIIQRPLDYVDKQYLGVIEDIDDPRKEGRARIRVFSIHGEIATEALPWAYPRAKSCFFGNDSQGGSISIPKLGAIVTIRFNNGNTYSPEYEYIHEISDQIREELEEEYIGSHILLFDGDLKLWFTLNKGLTLEYKGSFLNILPDSRVVLNHNNNSSRIELNGDNIIIDSTNTVNVITNKWNTDMNLLFNLIEELTSEIQDLTRGTSTFATGVGPTGPATNLPKIESILTRLKSMIK